MSPIFLTAAFLAHILPTKGPSDEPQADLEPDRPGGDPEKGASSSGTSQDQAFYGERHDCDGDDTDQETKDDDDHDSEENRDIERQSRQGVPLTSTGTVSSSIKTLSRPSLPSWLVKIKDVLFGPLQDREEFFKLPTYRRAAIISGNLIPFAILLEVPGLTEDWYVRTDGHQIVQSRKNPPWVVASLSISLALAVLANIALVYRFLERRPKRSTIVSIIALTLHDILNIVTVVTWTVQHRFHDGFTNGAAFWMTIFSTVVSMITNVILMWDLVKTPNFDQAGSGITRKQRSLVIITIIFVPYIAIGALISALTMTLTFIDALYFTIVTTLTIGFGDIVPITAAQRAIVCLYAVLGIIILGAAIRLTSAAVLEALQVGYLRRSEKFKRRRRERKREHEQVRRWCAAVEERLVERELDVWTPNQPAQPSPPHHRGSSFVSQAMYLNTEALPPDVLESAAQEAGVPLENFIGRKFGRRARPNSLQHHHQRDRDQQQKRQGKEHERPARVPLDSIWTVDDGRMHEGKSRTRCGAWWDRARQALHLANAEVGSPISQGDSSGSMSYQETVNDHERDERRSWYIKLGLAWVVFFMFWTIGSLIFSITEQWRYGSAMYFCVIAFTSIGYGDLAPQSTLGRGIFVFWAIFGVGAMTILFTVVTDAFSSKYRSVTHDKTFDRAVHRYRQDQGKATRRKADENGELRSGRSSSQVIPALQANLARISSGKPVPLDVVPPTRTLAEAEDRLRTRVEPLPAIILKEVYRLRDHTRYFLLANGHADILGLQVGGANVTPTPNEWAVPENLKQLLDEVAQEEGFEERLKQEVWDNAHARNTLVLLSLEKGAKKMLEAAELALETLTERNQLLLREERGIEVEKPEEICKGEE